MTSPTEVASVRYIVDDVAAAVDFYSKHFGFKVNMNAPAFAEVVRGPLRLLISGPPSSGAKITPPELAVPGRNRIHLIFADLDAEMARLRAEGLTFLTDVFSGPGGRQVLLADPSGNLVELFQNAAMPNMPQPAKA